MQSLIIVPKYNPRIYGKDYTYLFPISFGYIIAAIKKAGHPIDCLNLNHCIGIKKPISETLNKKKYDNVLLGSDTSGYHTLNLIIKNVRKHSSNPKIVLGGPILTSEPVLMFNHLDIDFGVIGEGEETIVEFLDGKKINTIKGLAYRKEGKSFFNEPREVVGDLGKLPFPDYDSMGFQEFLENMKASHSFFYTVIDYPKCYYVMGSRSCPYQCTFCWNHGRYRERPIKEIIGEMEMAVEKYKINLFYLIDECVAINKSRLIELCGKIQELRKKISWEIKWICTLRVDVVTTEILKLLKQSGCCMVSYGFESYSPKVLKSMKKGITPEQIRFAIKETLKNKMGLQGSFIFGDIAETAETAETTLDFWAKCGAQFNIGFIRPYPNSEIYQHCIKKGLIKDRIKFIQETGDMGDDFMNMTDNMTEKEFRKMSWNVVKAIGKYRRIVIPSLTKTNKNTYTYHAKCPFCSHEANYPSYEIKNIFSYSQTLFCRNCYMRFYVASSFRKLLIRNYHIVKPLRDFKLRAQKEVALALKKLS